ncbi:hypothetical protein ACFOZY_13490 [Chungangia koreensis]|uniref:Uncharacterized protein n=1 Tax=Chungangia koreensis TaxID=752657 RepID=A0ABV8X6A1_9LACT
MKKLKVGFLIAFIMMMASCSNTNEKFTFEEELLNALDNSGINYYEEIIHYEIKDNFIIGFYTADHSIFHTIYDLSSGTIKNIGRGGSVDQNGGIAIFEKHEHMPSNLSYFSSNNPDVEKVEVRGELAKKINYQDLSFWIIFSDEPIAEEDLIAYDDQGNQVNLIQ